ncbi:hypothetical protein FG379_002160 [Cryptosporidium bovis]|uniref:uncharacterized protein n=1 Tax=Cryptosporidium bovis TaxID=310047 RepID=UPI00351AA236|nr:hypothetical protein FG379_002160 [Cryptosporidium bovis]
MLNSFLLGNITNQYGTNLIEYYIANNSDNKKISGYFLGFTIIIVLLLFYYYGINGELIVISAIFPSFIIIYILRKQIYTELGIRSFSELFIIGSTFSVIITLALESIVFYMLKLNDYNEDANSNSEISIHCNCISNSYFTIKYGCIKGLIYCLIIMIIKYIIIIGLIEELAKLIGLLTLKYELYDLNMKSNFFTHYISSNYGYVLSGISCSLGFATVENIAYLINCDNDIYKMILVSIARGVLSVPFHVSASGFSCILLSNIKFNMFYDGIGIFLLKLLCLIPTSVLHGIYDTCLVLLMEFNINEENAEKTSVFINKKITIHKYINKIMNMNNVVIKDENERNKFLNICFRQNQTLLSTLFLLLAIMSYILCLFLFIYNFVNLKRKRYNRINNNVISVELYSNEMQIG